MNQPHSTNPAEIYEQFFVPGIFARWTPLLLAYAAPRHGEHVLDVACGTGIVARCVAPLVGAEGKVIGLDVSPTMLAVARALPAPKGAVIEWREGSALSLPDGPFDLVVCQQGLQFFPDREAALREMRRVLAPGGRVALSVWQSLQRHPVYKALREAEAHHLNISVDTVATAFSLGDAGELYRLLNAAGFQHIAITPVSLTVRFPSPERFVALTLFSSAAVVPAFSTMDAESRSALVQAVSRDIDATLRTYIEGDTIAFPMHAHMAVAHV